MEFTLRDIIVISLIFGQVWMLVPWVRKRVDRMNENNRKKKD